MHAISYSMLMFSTIIESIANQILANFLSNAIIDLKLSPSIYYQVCF